MLFVYLAYDLVGSYGWIYEQAIYSMLSLMSANGWDELPEGVSFIAYVDAPERLEPLTGILEVRRLQKERMLSDMGPHRYIHRLKTTTLIDAGSKTSSPVAFIDCDIHFRKPILERIRMVSPGTMLMYAREFPILEPPSRRQGHFPRLLRAVTAGGEPIPRDPGPYIYNSGVIGLHPADFHLLDKNLALIDRGLDVEACHVWEQFALSIALAYRKMKVITLEDLAHHYWDQREEYAAAIAPILRAIRENKMSVSDAVAYVREHPLNVPPYRKRSLPVRLLRKLAGKSKMPSIRIQEEIPNLFRHDRG